MSIQSVVNKQTIESILLGLCIQKPRKIGIIFTYPRSNEDNETWRFSSEFFQFKILCTSQGFMWYHPQKEAYMEVPSDTMTLIQLCMKRNLKTHRKCHYIWRVHCFHRNQYE